MSSDSVFWRLGLLKGLVETIIVFNLQRDVAHPISLKSLRGWKWARWLPCSSIKVSDSHFQKSLQVLLHVVCMAFP